MSRPRHRACVVLLALAPLRTAVAQRAGTSLSWTLSGSFLSLLSRSRTVVPPAEDYTLDLNRLRLELVGRLSDALGIELQDDIELLAGSYLRTRQYAVVGARAATTGLDLEHDLVERGDLLARHRPYRATLSWSGARTDVRVGRQRVALGTGRFWSPLDLLNPIDPTRLERDYRSGIDAVLVERKLGALARADAVYAPATSRVRAVAAGYLHGNARGADYSLLAGRFRGDAAIGADFATTAGGLGLRGEATVTRPASGPRYSRALFGADYGFPSTLTLTVELYFNGQGASEPARYDLPALLAGRTVSLARRYGAVAASYELTPLLKAVGYGVLNADDRSGVLWPRLEYSASANLDVAAGVQRFVGTTESEYGRLSSVWHGEVRWFF